MISTMLHEIESIRISPIEASTADIPIPGFVRTITIQCGGKQFDLSLFSNTREGLTIEIPGTVRG